MDSSVWVASDFGLVYRRRPMPNVFVPAMNSSSGASGSVRDHIRILPVTSSNAASGADGNQVPAMKNQDSSQGAVAVPDVDVITVVSDDDDDGDADDGGNKDDGDDVNKEGHGRKVSRKRGRCDSPGKASPAMTVAQVCKKFKLKKMGAHKLKALAEAMHAEFLANAPADTGGRAEMASVTPASPQPTAPTTVQVDRKELEKMREAFDLFIRKENEKMEEVHKKLDDFGRDMEKGARTLERVVRTLGKYKKMGEQEAGMDELASRVNDVENFLINGGENRGTGGGGEGVSMEPKEQILNGMLSELRRIGGGGGTSMDDVIEDVYTLIKKYQGRA